MKHHQRMTGLLILTLVITLAISGCAPATPAEACYFFLGPGAEDVVYDDVNQNCYLKVSGDPCYPQYTILHWDGPDYLTSWSEAGCGNLPNSVVPDNRTVIHDPLGGSSDLEGSGAFKYDPNTCAGVCSINLHGITSAARNDLDLLSGKVIGKTYVQIKDDNGDLEYGNFTLCLPAGSAKNPAFYRHGGGWWRFMGGWWKGSQFCMAGTMSGNYVLVDLP